jgi:transposase
VWFTDEAVAAWRAEPRTTPGGQPHYSALAITTALTLRAVFHLALRQTEGLIGSILHLLALDLPVPDHSTLGRRAQTLPLPVKSLSDGGAVHLLVDSTGLKLCGPGEWLIEKHGTSKRRSWRKLHIGMDANTGRIVAVLLTDRGVDDASQVGPLLDQIEGPVDSLTADGAYDRTGVYADVDRRHPDAKVVVPPRVDAVFSATAGTAPTQRDRHIQDIATKGRAGWQAARGYNLRALVEAQIGRYKAVIGQALRSHTEAAQAIEAAIAVDVLNRMLDLGRPQSVRVA